MAPSICPDIGKWLKMIVQTIHPTINFLSLHAFRVTGGSEPVVLTGPKANTEGEQPVNKKPIVFIILFYSYHFLIAQTVFVILKLGVM